MTAASSNDSNPDGPGLLEPLARERGIWGKWGLLVALLAVVVIGWQWHSAHRAEQTRRKLAAMERMVELEQQSPFRLRGGERLDAALGTGDFTDWQRAAVSLRTPQQPPKLDDPSVLYHEIAGPWFAELERKLRAAAGALAADDPDWEEVDAVLDQAAALLAQAEAAELRIANCIASPVLAAAVACVVEDALNPSFQRACLPWLASSRAALLVGDAKKLDEALAKLSWLCDQSRLTQVGALRNASNVLASQLAEAVQQPSGASGDGPSAWLLGEAATVEEQWVRTEASMDVARWQQANSKAKGLLELANEAKSAARNLTVEEAKARGVVPIAIWRAQFSKLKTFDQRWWDGDLAEADVQLTAVVDTEEQRVRWLAEVELAKELRARWMQVPEEYRKQVAADAETRLAEAVASESIDLTGFQAAQAAFSAATTAVGEAWLAESLVALPGQLRAPDARVGMQKWKQLEAWFGEEPRLQPLREFAAAAREDALRRSGLSAVAGSAKDDATGFPKHVIHSKTGIELVLIPAGEFLMGSPTTEPGHRQDEAQHRRVIRKPFYMGGTEVTQAQWRKVMGSNPSRFQGDNLPVEQVSWQDCQEFLAKVGDGMRLPSEAEWEYACRAGTTTPFAFGGSITPEQANYDVDHPYAGGARGEDRQRTVAAGSLPANAWGLHEMHGNVWEWCEDLYVPYPTSGTEEPNEASGHRRVFRGGSWFVTADDCRSADRDNGNPRRAYDRLGFRVVLAPILVQ